MPSATWNATTKAYVLKDDAGKTITRQELQAIVDSAQQAAATVDMHARAAAVPLSSLLTAYVDDDTDDVVWYETGTVRKVTAAEVAALKTASTARKAKG